MTSMTKKSKPRKTTRTSVGRRKRPASTAPSTTKKAQLIGFLSKKGGADIVGISKKFGWLPHTTRAALSRLRAAGYQVSRIKLQNGKPSKYHITAVSLEHNTQ